MERPSEQINSTLRLVYLQQKDPALAQRYLQATHQYIKQYSDMLGDYPYTKFVTVESFWETGWGMPSFTLLGSKVMRLPFILHSSFPHEILHNWWGNGVYVDNTAGNWSEGLTAYLADHYNKASKAERVIYRRNALQKYQAQTAAGTDFPLRDFRGRHDRTTQAVGYSKSLMVFHMLRKKLGDHKFFAGLRLFYQQHQFAFASFTDLEQAFANSSKQPLDTFFQQWLARTGAPKLTINHSQTSANSDGTFTLKLTLQQQTAPPFTIDVPLQVQDSKGNFNYQMLHMSEAEQTFTLRFKSPVRRFFVDPAFDVLRLPDKRDVPPALNVLFNRQAKAFVLPSNASETMLKAWREFASTFSYGQTNMPVQLDSAGLPDSDIVVLMGSDNALLPTLLANIKQPLALTPTHYTLNEKNYHRTQYSLALTLQNGRQQIILLGAANPNDLHTLTRKLPHYGKYSYILFNNASAKNVAKGQWQVKNSPMAKQVTQ